VPGRWGSGSVGFGWEFAEAGGGEGIVARCDGEWVG